MVAVEVIKTHPIESQEVTVLVTVIGTSMMLVQAAVAVVIEPGDELKVEESTIEV